MGYKEVRYAYVTPRGYRAGFTIRLETNDHNTVWSSCNEDEYGLRGRLFSGVAFDIGAYIGSVAVALAMDNPDLTVLAVEPVEDNARLIWLNARDNEVGERIRVVHGAAGPPGVSETKLHSRFRGSEIATHHAFVGTTEVGNSEVADAWRLGTDHDITTVPCFDFGQLVEMAGAPCLVKIDCEGAEFGILGHPLVADVPLIIGEWHNIPYADRHRSGRADLVAVLPNHDVTFSGLSPDGPEGFVAVRK